MPMAAAYLEKQAVDHDQITDCELAAGNAVSRQQHGRAECRAEDDVLPPNLAPTGCTGSGAPLARTLQDGFRCQIIVQLRTPASARSYKIRHLHSRQTVDGRM